MPALPEKVSQAWEDRAGPIILSTVAADGTPNAIYASSVSKYREDTIVVSDNFFSKTRENIRTGSRGSVLFITKDNTAYQIKGSFEYHTEGDIYDDMKKWNPDRLPGHAAAALKVEEVYSGAEKLL